MARIDPQLRIRLPLNLKRWIEDEAKRNHRSQNGEIVFWLEAARLRVEVVRNAREPATGHASYA